MAVGFTDWPLPALGDAVTVADTDAEPDGVAVAVELTVGSATDGEPAGAAPAPVAGSVAGGAVEIGPATATSRQPLFRLEPTSDRSSDTV